MKLREYLELRNGVKALNSLSNKELKYLGIVQGKSGWLAEHHDRILNQNEVLQLTKLVLSSPYIKPSIKSNVKDLLLSQTQEYDAQFVYLMRSSNGFHKIGVSVDPEKRAKGLSGASGFKVGLVAYWKVKCNAKEVEKHLHGVFQDNRGVGEWFNFDHPFSFSEVEFSIPCEHIRMLG